MWSLVCRPVGCSTSWSPAASLVPSGSCNFHTCTTLGRKATPNEPTGWPKYNDIVYPPLKEGEPLRPAVSACLITWLFTWLICYYNHCKHLSCQNTAVNLYVNWCRQIKGKACSQAVHRVRTRSLYYHVIFSAICTLSHQMIYMLCKLLNIYLLKSLFLVLRKREYFLTKQPNESFGSCSTYVCRKLRTTGPTSSTVRRSCGTLHTW